MERRTVSVRGGMFEAEAASSAIRAEPLLFLHPSTRDDRAVPGRPVSGTASSPYHPGWGASTGLDHIDDPVDMAIYYYDFLDALGIESAHVVGHSIGGMFAAEVAAVDPHRVRKLVLCNPVGLWRDDAPVLDFFSEDMRKVQDAVWYDPECEAAVSRRPDMNDIEMVMAFMSSAVALPPPSLDDPGPRPEQAAASRGGRRCSSGRSARLAAVRRGVPRAHARARIAILDRSAYSR
jgi:pimeloyl-ACP methyl ester carboxylesterase